MPAVIKAYLGTGGDREVSSAPGASGVDEDSDVAAVAATRHAVREPDDRDPRRRGPDGQLRRDRAPFAGVSLRVGAR